MACQSKEFLPSTAQQSFVHLSTRIRGGGGLNCEAKALVLVVTPPPLFPGSRSQKGGGGGGGGRNSEAVRYNTYIMYMYTVGLEIFAIETFHGLIISSIK